MCCMLFRLEWFLINLLLTLRSYFDNLCRMANKLYNISTTRMQHQQSLEVEHHTKQALNEQGYL